MTKSSSPSSRSFEKRLQVLRRQIDLADARLLKALAKRAHIIEQIAVLKMQEQAPIRQKSRWEKLLQNRLGLAKKLKVDIQLVKDIFKIIQIESIERQAKVMKKNSNGRRFKGSAK